MRLARAPQGYDGNEQSHVRTAIEAADKLNLKKNADILMGGASRIVLYSPDGTAFALVVDNAGALSTAAYP